jgi:cell division transport system permease protein
MGKSIDSFNRQRLRSSYVSVIISISLVLFLLGLLGILILNADHLAKEMRENFTFVLMLEEGGKEADLRAFQKELDLEPFVKSSAFISKDEAAAILQEELGEDFLDFLGFNPIPNSIEIQLKAAYVQPEFLKEVEANLSNSVLVAEVVYDRDLIQIVNENIQKISVGIVLIAVLLLLISIALINSSIRLAIYSRRFIIKTMQLVGATKSFIQRPFMAQSLKMGFLGGLIAAGLLFLGTYYTQQYLKDWNFLANPMYLFGVMGGVVLLGLLLSWLCTFFAVRKYLNLKTDQLY